MGGGENPAKKEGQGGCCSLLLPSLLTLEGRTIITVPVTYSHFPCALCSSVGCYLHFTDRETEAHRGQVTWPKPHGGRKALSSALTPKSKALTAPLCFQVNSKLARWWWGWEPGAWPGLLCSSYCSPEVSAAGVGAVLRGELQGEISGLEERSMFLRCHAAPGDPRESPENETGPQGWGSWAPITGTVRGPELVSLEKAGGLR